MIFYEIWEYLAKRKKKNVSLRTYCERKKIYDISIKSNSKYY
jgi:hypothetical protein